MGESKDSEKFEIPAAAIPGSDEPAHNVSGRDSAFPDDSRWFGVSGGFRSRSSGWFVSGLQKIRRTGFQRV